MHLDVMDGHFVPNMSFGAMVCAGVKQSCAIPCEAHLMVSNPDPYLKDYAAAGMKRLIVHVEACNHLYSTLQQIKALGMQAGVALNPLTPLGMIEEALRQIDQPCLMLTGDTATHHRGEVVARFQSEQCPILLISLKAGGASIMLSSAGVMINGTMVMINSGGAPGAGSGASPKPSLPASEPVLKDDPLA